MYRARQPEVDEQRLWVVVGRGVGRLAALRSSGLLLLNWGPGETVRREHAPPNPPHTRKRKQNASVLQAGEPPYPTRYYLALASSRASHTVPGWRACRSEHFLLKISLTRC